DLRPLGPPGAGGPGAFGRRGQLPNGPPPNGPPPDGVRPFRQEIESEARKHLRAAREALAALEKDTPDHPEELFLQARVLLFGSRFGAERAREQRQKGIAILQQLVDRQPQNDTFRFELADALLPPPGPLGEEVDTDVLQQVVTHARELTKQQPAHPE